MEARFSHDLTVLAAVMRTDGLELVGPYVDSRVRTDFRCAEGHIFEAAPGAIRGRLATCPECRAAARRERHAAEIAAAAQARETGHPRPISIASKDRFYRLVEARGGRVTGQYVDTKTPVEVDCGGGHAYAPRPCSVLSANNWCRDCVRGNPPLGSMTVTRDTPFVRKK